MELRPSHHLEREREEGGGSEYNGNGWIPLGSPSDFWQSSIIGSNPTPVVCDVGGLPFLSHPTPQLQYK
jgi:hypothetical protein